MKNLLPKNGLSGAGVATLIAACTLLVLIGCRNPLDLRGAYRGAETGGTGIVALTINGQGPGRTIMPAVPGGNLGFWVEFFSTDGVNPDFTASWNGQSLIELRVGEWSLQITSYIPGDAGERRDMAASERIDVVVAPGVVTVHTVVLVPIASGTGTFTWDVSFPPEVSAAEMRILRLEDGGPYLVNTLVIHGPGAVGKTGVELPVGLYRVVFALSGPGGASAEIGKLLHVYRNMESRFTDGDRIFADFIFPAALLQTVLNAWDGTEWNFDLGPGRRITYRHFGLLGIDGVCGENFNDIERHLTLVTNANLGNIPVNGAGLKALVDAARISFAAENPAFVRASFYWDSGDAVEAITGTAVNVDLEADDFAWTGDYTVTVTVGAYAVDVVFVPVPVENVVIVYPTPAPTDENPYQLEATFYRDFVAAAVPFDARTRGIRWEIPDSAHEGFVEITEYNAAEGTASIGGLSAGLARVYAVSTADADRRVRVPINVFPYGARVPITGIGIDSADPVTLEVGYYTDLDVVLTPAGTTQRGFTVTCSAPGVVSVEGVRITGVYPGTATVTVTSTGNAALTASVTVNVIATPVGVTVTPADADVPRLGTLELTATVEGPAGVSQDVVWSVDSAPAGVEIDPDGVLTLTPDAAINSAVTVRAAAAGHPGVFGTATVTVLPPVPDSVAVTAVDADVTDGAITVTRGIPQTFNAVVGPEGALQNVTWSVVPINGASTAGAEISPAGVLTTAAPLVHGTAFTVRATVDGPAALYADVTVTVNVTPAGINITGYAGEIARGGTATFTAQVLPHPAAPQDVDWSVHAYPGHPAAAPTGVTIPGGVLTLTADADVSYNQVLVVRAAVPGTGYAETRQVAVTVIPESVVITSPAPPAASAYRGTSLVFAARVEPYSAASQAVVWSVAPAESGAYFVGNALQIPSGLPQGSTLTVTAAAAGVIGAVSDPFTVTVTAPAPTGVLVTPGTESVERNQTRVFTAAVSPSSAGAGVAYQTVVWSVSPQPEGVRINASGVLTIDADASVYHGDTLTVRATAYGTGVYGTATVNVDIPPTGVTIDPQTLTMIRGGEPQTFTATVQPAGTVRSVVWSLYPQDAAGVSITYSGLTATVTVNPGTPAVGAFDVIATAYGYPDVSGAAMVNVLEPGGFVINRPDFPPPDGGLGDLEGPTISLLPPGNAASVSVSLDIPGLYADSIRWFFGGMPFDNIAGGNLESHISGEHGETFNLRPRIRGELLEVGTHFLTVEVIIDGEQRGRRIAFEVTM